MLNTDSMLDTVAAHTSGAFEAIETSLSSHLGGLDELTEIFSSPIENNEHASSVLARADDLLANLVGSIRKLKETLPQET